MVNIVCEPGHCSHGPINPPTRHYMRPTSALAPSVRLNPQLTPPPQPAVQFQLQVIPPTFVLLFFPFYSPFSNTIPNSHRLHQPQIFTFPNLFSLRLSLLSPKTVSMIWKIGFYLDRTGKRLSFLMKLSQPYVWTNVVILLAGLVPHLPTLSSSRSV